GGFAESRLAHPDRSLQEKLHRLGWRAQELGHAARGEELLSSFLGPDQLPERVDPWNELRVLLPERVELTVRTFALAPQAEQLAEQEAQGRIGGMKPDVLQRRFDGPLEIARVEQFIGAHGGRLLPVDVNPGGPEPARFGPASL